VSAYQRQLSNFLRGSRICLLAVRRSVYLRHIDTGSDGSDEWEIQALTNPIYDLHRLGIFFTASPRHADILLVTGIGTTGMVEPLRRTLDAMPAPTVVVSVYTSEAARHDGVPIHRAVVRQLLQRKPSHGATVLRGILGFHGDHQPHGDKLFSLGRHVPVVTIVIDTPDTIAESFDVVDELTRGQGLVTSEMVPALVSTDDDGRRGGPPIARHRY
jgi:Ni,Fe-hydrogenase III small subunit